MENIKVYQLAVPRDNEFSPEAAAAMFSSMSGLERPNWWKQKIFGEELVRFSLETVVVNQQIHFFATINESLASYWESQFQAAYPSGVQSEQEDYLLNWKDLSLHYAQMCLAKDYYYPIKTYKEFSDVDPMSLVLGVMSRARTDEVMAVQIVVTGAGTRWRSLGESRVLQGIRKKDGTIEDIPQKSLAVAKLSENGFWVAIRLAASSRESLGALANAYGGVGRGDGNSLKIRKPMFWGVGKMKAAYEMRSIASAPPQHYFTVSELATLWHMPNKQIQLHNITWAKNLNTEAPDNLPVYKFLSDDERESVNFFGKTSFKGEDMVFGIKRWDRMRHMYVIGKSGVGKSTLLENMAISDMKKGNGMAFLDPHGSSVETLLNYIPKNRINDVIYFDPADTQFPIPLNILEVPNLEHREFVASGIVSIFSKLYAHSWGPRLEYILRNTLLTLTEVPGSTLPNVLDMLNNKSYREKIYPKIHDEVMLKFWKEEFDALDEKQRVEAISSILNKVGQFVSSPMIRKIISTPKSNVDIEWAMNEGKILLVNLSQGRMGEDNAALMGAMIVTKIQLAAMRRAQDQGRDWRDFYLYVDEFQNFATSSFIKILSEARKYRLGLILANQYVGQIDKTIMDAIIGNAGTLVNFLVGAPDAAMLASEYAEVFGADDLTHLGRGEVVVKLAIDGLTSRPFFAHTLPPAGSKNQNKDKVLRLSRERWGMKD